MTLWLVRHAHAGSRQSWDGDQDERPLSRRGRAEADAVARLLANRPIRRILSSRTTRCLQTVEPLAVKLGLTVEIEPALYEGTYTDEVLQLLEGLAGTAAVLCSHGDVIPNVLNALQRRGLALPGNAACEKGSAWEFTFSNGVASAATYHPPAV